ncbi:MAG TPA: hypothetical protein EYQ86_00305 [Bacteroidetes bacterium]|nr:hypothetical protein [Bacteroidota bacterium]
MAVIGKLRKRAGLVIFIIALSMILFVLTDALGSSNSLTGGQDNIVGEILGEEIEYQEYSNKKKKQENDYKRNTNKAIIDDQTKTQIEEYVWGQMIMEKVMGEQWKALGIEIGEDEWNDLHLSNNPHPQIRRFFSDPKTGIFKREAVTQFLASLEDDSGEKRYQWEQLKKYIIDTKVQERYDALYKKGFYVSSWLAREEYMAKEAKCDVSYICLNYDSISDNEIDISESEIKEYFEAHKKKFSAKKEKRSVEYVQFKVLPSGEDSMRSMLEIQELKQAFTVTQEDSLFIVLNSEKTFNNDYITKENISSIRKDSLFDVQIGEIVGPYLEGNEYVIVKVLDRKMIPDSVKARHILLEIKANTQVEYQEKVKEAKTRMDSIKEVLAESPQEFEVLAKAISQDPGSKDKGGNLGWIKQGEMVSAFNDAIFYSGDKKGYHTIFTNFGIHLIDVQDYNPTKNAVKTGFISSSIMSGDYTVDSVFLIAQNFLFDVKKANGSTEAEKLSNYLMDNDGYNKRTPDAFESNESIIPGLGNAKEIVKWAFTNELGKMKLINLNNEDNYIIVALSEVEGEDNISDEIKEQIERELIKQKKGDVLLKTYLDRINTQNLEEISKNTEIEINNISGVTFNNAFNPGIGRDYAFAGVASGLEIGKTSRAFKGEKGVYVIRLDACSEPDQKNAIFSKRAIQAKLEGNAVNRAQDALYESAESADYRYKF